MPFYSVMNVLKGRQHLESKWLMNLLANRTNYGERWFPALASSTEPHWGWISRGKPCTQTLLSPQERHICKWRTLIEILKIVCWGKGGWVRLKTQHRLWEQKVLSQIYTFPTAVMYVKENTDDKFSFSAHISRHHFNYSYHFCCLLHSPSIRAIIPMFSAALFVYPMCRCSKYLGKGQSDYHLRKQ